MDSNHFTLIEGKHPTTSNELAISKLMADQMMESDKSFIDYTSILNYKFNTYSFYIHLFNIIIEYYFNCYYYKCYNLINKE